MLGVVLMVIAIGVLGWTAADWFLSLPLRPSHSPPLAPTCCKRITSKRFDGPSQGISPDQTRTIPQELALGRLGAVVGPDPNAKETTRLIELPPTEDSMPPGVALESKFITPLMAVTGRALVCGTFLLVFGRNKFTKTAGAATLLAGFLSHATIIKELKIGEIFKVDTLTVDAKINSRLQGIGSLGHEHIESIGGFVPGKAEVTFTMQQAIDNACSKLREEIKAGKEGPLLIVGSTDRVPLGHNALKQYESNFGPACARAEAVKLTLSLLPEKSENITSSSLARSALKCRVPATQMLALVSGPKHTPELVLPHYDGIQLSTDRSVDLWALWAWHEPPGKHASVQVTIGKSEGKKE